MARTNAADSARDRAKTETREALLAAALSLIPERGLDVSLDDICDRAGYTRGAFYVHFADRDALLAAVMDRVGRRVLDVLIGATGATEGEDLAQVFARFESAFATGVYPLTRAGGVRPYQLLDACARSPAVRKQYVALVTEATTRLGSTLEKGQRRKSVRGDVRAADLAMLLVAIVIGVQTMVDLEAPLDLFRAASSVLKLWTVSPGSARPRRARSPRARRTRRT